MNEHTTCCVVGGGPAGVMTGYLMARAGVRVTILEKHKDFFRDFRGDTVHPSTLQVMNELGLADQLLRLPHQKVSSVRAHFADSSVEIADLHALKTPFPFVALMPQWDFLNFLADQGRKYSGFKLQLEHEAVDLISEGARVGGVVVRTPEGTGRITADLVIACDGRRSELRAAAALPVRKIGVPIDVLWFRVGRKPGDQSGLVLGNINYGRVLILIDRGTYFQAGLIIPKDSFTDLQRDGLPSFRSLLTRIAPYLEDRVDEITDWDQIKLLSVQINRLTRWHQPGLLCIGDAAHAMSPAFGVGINLAIQDAVATANILAGALRKGKSTDALLEQVQRRREFPARATQLLQVFAHQGLVYVFHHQGLTHPPLPLRIAARIPGIQHVVGRVIGVGIRPEHVTPAKHPLTTLGRIARRVAGFCAGFAAAVSIARRRAYGA